MEAGVPGHSTGQGGPVAARSALSGLRVALVHDWLTGMRGGAKCLEVLCRAWQGRDAYLQGGVDRPIRRALAAHLLNDLRKWDRATAAGVTHFVAISETVRRRIAQSYGRESRVIPPPVETSFYTPDRAERG